MNLIINKNNIKKENIINEKVLFLFSRDFQKTFSSTKMTQMNLFPICVYESTPYFYTNDHNQLYEDQIQGKFLIIDQPIQSIQEYKITSILLEAVLLKATDLHLFNNQILYKKQGETLYKKQIEEAKIEEIKNFLKIFCNLNILSNRDESSSIPVIFLEEKFYVRVSFFPTEEQPLISFRIIYKEPVFLSHLIPKEIIDEIFKESLVLIGGLTGMGKTTFLYKLLYNYNHYYENQMIISLEDPIEYKLNFGVQRDLKNQDYESSIKSVLRHRPDLIIIGEIRDKKTGEAALRALLTGHKIICTIHINQSTENIWKNTFHRLEELGLRKDYLKTFLKKIITIEKDYKYKIHLNSLA